MLSVMTSKFIVDRFKKPVYVDDFLGFARSNWACLLILVVAFFVANYLYCYFNHVSAVFHLSGDAIDYNYYATSVAKHFVINYNVDRLPGYVTWLAVIYKIFGAGNFFVARLGNVLLSCIICVFLYAFSIHFVKNKAISIIAFLLYAFNPIVLYYNTQILSEPFTAFVVLLAFAFLYLTVRYNSLFFLLVTAAFYIVGFYSKLFLFYVFPVIIVILLPMLVKKRRILLILGFSIILLLGYKAYQSRVKFVDNVMHYRNFSTLSEVSLNRDWLSVVLYYEGDGYKKVDNYNNHTVVQQLFQKNYWKLRLKKHDPHAAKLYRLNFALSRFKGVVLGATNGILAAMFVPTISLYGYVTPEKLLPYESEQTKDVFFIINRLIVHDANFQKVLIYFLGWVVNMLFFLVAYCVCFYTLHKKFKLSIWTFLIISIFVYLINPVQGFFTSLAGGAYRYRYMIVPFLSFMYSVAIFSLLKPLSLKLFFWRK